MRGAFFLHYHLPALRLLLPLLAGLLLQWYAAPPLWPALAVGGVSLALLLLWMNAPRHWRLQAPTVQGLCVSLVMASLGAGLVWAQDLRHHPHYRPQLMEQPGLQLHLTLLEPLAPKPKSYKVLARMDSVVAPNGRAAAVHGQVMLYFRKADGEPPLQYGSRIALHRPPMVIENAGNPGGFDYKRHALFHGISHQAFVGAGQYHLLPGRGGNAFQARLFAINRWVVATLQRWVPGKDEAAIAAALVVGYRVALDDDLVQAYSNTGVVHIIAISGMHLSMISLLCLSLFKRMRLRGWQHKTSLVFTLSLMWLFALVSGGAPSILRAAVMASFVIGGQLLERRSNPLNLLALSALVLLVWNPFSWWDVGFQLSYAAVLGIMVFQQRFMQWFRGLQNGLLRSAAGLLCVSLAAQTFTLPLVMYHFHQFPLLFLITNLVAVPASALALYGLLGLLAFSWVSGMPWLLGLVCSGLIGWLNRFVLIINAVPYGLIDGIQLSIVQATLLTAIFALVAVAWLHRRPWAGWLASWLLVGFLSLHGWDYWQRRHQRMLIVYNLPRATGVDLVQGFHYRFVGQEALRKDGFMRNFHMKPARVRNRTVAMADSSAHLFVANGFYAFGKKIRVIHDRLPWKPPPVPDTAYLVLLTNNARLQLENVRQHVVARQFVADGSNSAWRLAQWRRVADSLHLPLHITTRQGAYVQHM